MFADLDESIRQLLIRHVPLDPAEIDVSFEAPDREWSGRLSRPTVNCFLYDVRENHEMRKTDWEMSTSNGKASRHKPLIRIDATYQVSAWARAPEDEHRLLWRVLVALARHAVLPEEVAQGALKEQRVATPVRVAQPDQTPRNPADLWQALDNRIRPSLTYVVTLALDPDIVQTAPLVLTGISRLQQRDGTPIGESIRIGGTVRPRGETAGGLAGATVLLQETGAEVTTDVEGRFVFGRAPRGPITLVVRAAGRPEVQLQTDVPATSYDVEI
jgi:hypothetical protein